ncbi:MAG: polysaccharide deacetylase family protein [Elainellaceae cyanobacterium]
MDFTKMDLSKKLVFSLAAIAPDAVFFKPTQDKVIALTIDDVPTAGEAGYPSTQRILEAIARHNQSLSHSQDHAHATIFVIGDQLTHGNDILYRMLEQGHELGNHGMGDRFHVSLPANDFEAEIWRSHCLLTDSTEAAIRWFRPGRAFYNPAMVTTLKKLQPQGYSSKMALASMLPLDTRNEFKNPAFTLRYALRFVFPGAILVLHGGSHERDRNTAAVLKALLPRLHCMGYRVVTLSQLFALPPTG